MELREQPVEPAARASTGRPLQRRGMQQRPVGAIPLKGNHGVLGPLQLMVDLMGGEAAVGSVSRRRHVHNGCTYLRSGQGPSCLAVVGDAS